MDSVAMWFGSQENQEQIEQIERRRIRDASNVMELSEKRFVHKTYI